MPPIFPPRQSAIWLRQERDTLRKPDAEAENLKTLTTNLLTQVSERIDLVTDLKRLAADYATARKDRADSEQKRMDQRATERMNAEADRWDWVLAFDHHDARRTARQRLEPERAAAGEKIEARHAVEALAEPVEQRLADAVGRGAKRDRRRKFHQAAAPLAGDDAHAVAPGRGPRAARARSARRASHGGHRAEIIP